jgi:glutathione S-transferase
MMAVYKLYGRPGSGSFAVQVALEEIGAKYERIWVGREAADVAQFRATNPTGRVPALVLPDGTTVFESAAMLIHLALEHPQSALAPPSGTGRHAVFLQWMVFLSANVYEAALRIYYSARYSTRGAAEPEAAIPDAQSDSRFSDSGSIIHPTGRKYGPRTMTLDVTSRPFAGVLRGVST